MNVECQNCGTEYSLDETLVASTGTSVRCSKCSVVFKVFPSGGVSSSEDEWRVRQVSGHIVAFKRMGVLQQWISQGRLSKDDELSRNNGPWKRIGDMPEMVSFFPKSATEPPVSSGFPRTDPGERGPTISGSPPERSATPPPPGSNENTQPSRLMDNQATMAQTVLAPTSSSAKKSDTIQPGPIKTADQIKKGSFAAKKDASIEEDSAVTEVLSIEDSAVTDVSSTDDSAVTEVLQVRARETEKGDPATKPTKPMKPGPFVRSTTPAQEVKTASTAGLGTAKTEPNLVTSSKPKQPKPDAAGSAEAHEPDLSQIPAAEDRKSWDDAGKLEVDTPAWTEKSDSIRHYEDDLDDLPPPKRKTGRWVALIIGVLIIGLIAYFFKFERVRMGNIFDRVLTSQTDDRYKKFYDHGMEGFLLDSEIHYKQADREFQKVLALEENHAPTLTALAEMYAVWAQYVRDATLDAETDFSGVAPSSTNERELERLKREFKEKLAEADRWAKQAIEANKEDPGPNRAMADVTRLEGDLGKARLYLEKARSDGENAETEYISILIDQDSGKPAEGLEKRLNALLKDQPLIRAMYRKARIAASRGEIGTAKGTLDKLFELNSDHLWGRDLAARMDDKKTVAVLSAEDGAIDGTASVAPDAGALPVADTAGKDTAGDTEQETEQTPPTAVAVKPAVPVPPGGGGGSVDAMIIQASKHQENGRTGEAIALYEKVLERSPSNTEALSGMAYCYLDKGNAGRAIASFRRVLGVNPSFGPALLGLAETFKSQGQKEQALKYYKKYLVVKPNGRQSDLARRNIERLEQEVGTKEVAEETKDTSSSESQATSDVEITPTENESGDSPGGETPTSPPSEEPKPETPAEEPSGSSTEENQPPPT